MRLHQALQTLLGTSVLLAATACGGSGDADPMALIQKNDFKGAIAVIEPALKTVEQGSDAHRDLLIMHAEALAAESPAEAAKSFTEAMTAHKDLIQPADVKYVVNRIAKHGHYVDAIDVLDLGLKTWDKDETLAVVLEELKQAIIGSGDEGGNDKLKSLGYL